MREPKGQGLVVKPPKLSGKRIVGRCHPWRDLRGTEGVSLVDRPGDLSGTRTGGAAQVIALSPLFLFQRWTMERATDWMAPPPCRSRQCAAVECTRNADVDKSAGGSI